MVGHWDYYWAASKATLTVEQKENQWAVQKVCKLAKQWAHWMAEQSAG